MSYNESDALSLMAKIEALDLTEREQSALEALFDAARGGDDVEGYWFYPGFGTFQTTKKPVRSQAEKRVEQHREEAVEKWGQG